MKRLIFIIFVTIMNLFSNNLLAQHITDTVFLLKEGIDSHAHTIFIEPNKNPKNYKSINNFNSFPKTSNKNKIVYKDLPSHWIPLYSLKGNYYVYLPCDFSNNQKIGLYKQKIFFEDFEFYSYNINSFKKYNDRYIINYNGFENEITKLEIDIIDKKRGIAVFKYTRNKNEIYFKLMLDSKNAQLFPLIVNDCEYSKTKEFEFDVLNYEKMVKASLN